MSTTEQLILDLDLSPIKPIPVGFSLDMDIGFKAFHEANPHVYRSLRALAFQARQAGRKRIGMKFLFERLRWEYMIRTNHDESDWRLNNNYTARYARLLMAQEPELDGFFEIRELRG